MRLLLRGVSRLQVAMLQKGGFWSRLGLTLFYTVEVMIYSLRPQGFLTRRQKAVGPNFAALGKLIVGEYREVAPRLMGPQARGPYLGRLRLLEDRFSPYFLLFLSNRAGPEAKLHRQVRDLLHRLVLGPAVERASRPDARALIEDFVSKAAEKGDPPSIVRILADLQTVVLRYVLLVLLELRLDERQTETLRSLIFSFTPFTSMILSRARPFALPWTTGRVRNGEDELCRRIDESPPMARFAELDSAGLDRQAFVKALAQMIAIAGCQGGLTMATGLLTQVPTELPKNLDDREEVRRVVLECLRRHAPVNNVNVLATEEVTLEIAGKEERFPAGTVLALSIGLASLDGGEFADPLAFRPERPNLCPAMLNFNGVGEGGPRQCPGRGVAEALGMELLTAWRRRTRLEGPVS